MDYNKVIELANSIPAIPNANHVYGTAGFRSNASLLDSVFLRCGMLAALRAFQTSQGIGIMVTASHNPISDNGVKMIDPNGGMLDMAWEKYACEIANCSANELRNVISSIIVAEKIDTSDCEGHVVHVGRDTRPSSSYLSDLVRRGAEAMGCVVIDHGLVTTPQLHHIVRFSNLPDANPSFKGIKGYYSIHAAALSVLVDPISFETALLRGPLFIDCAHGIGANAITEMSKHIDKIIDIRAVNTGVTDEEKNLLNDGCGAEYVQKGRKAPSGMDTKEFEQTRNCSLDGDADRVVYHYFDKDNQWNLLDGDKIATLLALFVSELCKEAGIVLSSSPNKAEVSVLPKSAKEVIEFLRSTPISLGLVQTAYANGASTKYLQSHGLTVLAAKTGVKFVHAKAELFDIGVYFEANGHGTVLFSPYIADLLEQVADLSTDELVGLFGGEASAALAFRRLASLPRLVNQAIGDAISDLLLVEAVLMLKGWTLDDWNALYQDYPTAQDKLSVHDKNVFVTTEDETRLIKPEVVQNELDRIMKKYSNSRTFVRPSGTEDIIRLYCEADTEEDAMNMLKDVKEALNAGGYVRS